MTCEWGRTDCQNADKKCDLCFTEDQHYLPPKQKKAPAPKRTQKADNRMGGAFEYKNHQQNQELLTGSSMTPNSGAWIVKGDEQIRGLVNVMEELKTKVTKQAPGKETFTIKKEWLTKLNREAKEVNEDFWYLKFSFHEHQPETYVIVESDMIMSMIVTLVEDRKKTKQAQAQIDLADKRKQLVEAENIQLQAQINLLKAELAYERGEHNEV